MGQQRKCVSGIIATDAVIVALRKKCKHNPSRTRAIPWGISVSQERSLCGTSGAKTWDGRIGRSIKGKPGDHKERNKSFSKSALV